MNDEKYTFNKEIKITEVDGTLVVESSDKIYVFEEFERSIIDYFNGENTVSEISEKLNETYKDSYNEKEFWEFLENLKETNMIKKI